MRYLEQVIAAFADLPTSLVYLVIGVVAAAENVFPPIPADTAVAFGAFLSGTGRISVWAVFAFTWIGNILSAIVMYLAARHLGRPFFRSGIGERLLRPAALRRIESIYRRYGTWGIFFSRFIPALRALVPPFAGVASVSATKTILPMAVASAIWYGAITYVASTVVREFDQITRLIMHFNRAAAAMVGTLVLVGIVWWMMRRRRRHRETSDG